MMLTVTVITAYLHALCQRARHSTGDESGQSEISYLLVVGGVVAIAALIIAAVQVAVTGKLAGFKL